ncbi:MAG TPA: hypothetical protein VF826_14785 [Chloroflexia bacterium]|jgi:hypothetical protein
MPDIAAINRHLQEQLEIRGLDSVPAVEAAKWLDDAGLLRDRKEGLPLRDLLRDGEVLGGRQEPPQPYGRWFIDRMK